MNIQDKLQRQRHRPIRKEVFWCSYAWQSCPACFCSVLFFVFFFFYLKNHSFSFNYMILCIKYPVIFTDFMCYVSITVLYSFSYFQAMLVPIDTTKFCYSLFPRRLFHLSCNTYWWLMKRLICFYLCMPILKQNAKTEHLSIF